VNMRGQKLTVLGDATVMPSADAVLLQWDEDDDLRGLPWQGLSSFHVSVSLSSSEDYMKDHPTHCSLKLSVSSNANVA
jgi:hypothetical protein